MNVEQLVQPFWRDDRFKGLQFNTADPAYKIR